MFDRFQELEKSIDVQKITANGIQVWPVIRVYIASQLVFEQDRSVKLDSSILKSAIKYFFYGFSNLFKKTDYLFLTSSDQRKKVGDMFVDRADIVAGKLPNTLIVELPSNGKHIDKKLCPPNALMSKFPFYFITNLLAKMPLKSVISGEEMIVEILDKSNVKLDYKKRINLFLAERKLMHFLIRWKKIKGLFLTTPYTNYGYVYACKEAGVEVIEFQHGTVSSSHYAYNLNKEYDKNFKVDQLLTFGDKEIEVFEDKNHYIDKLKVLPVGSFIIDSIMNQKPNDRKFEELKKKYNMVVAFTAQDALEKQFVPFLKKTAELDKKIAYVLIPRFKNEDYYKQHAFPENVIFIPWLNTYELMYLCDVHSTINSTTALEAPSLGTVNILANVENRAKDYFEGFINNEVCYFADSPQGYIEIINNIERKPKPEIAALNRHLFKPDFIKNVSLVIDQLNYN